MQKTLLHLVLWIHIFATAQINTSNEKYNVYGKVYDKTNAEELIGASVYLLNSSTGTITDFNGSYELNEIPKGLQKIICQYISYQNDTLEINISEDVAFNFQLVEETITLGSIDLITKVNRKEESYVVNLQKKSAGMLNTLSKKQMSITGSSNAADAVKNVSGVNVQGGKYVYVRGLSDRYSLVTLNGIALPSLDPNKNSVQMDLIPSNVIDNILVFKTFTPDLPGNFTGGLVDVNTSDFPDSLALNFNYSTGYRSLSNLNSNFTGQKSSSTDWLGYDDGSRDRPSFVQQNGINFFNPSSFADAYSYAQTQDLNIAEMTYDEFLSSDERWKWLEQARINANDSLTIATQSFSNNWNPEKFKSGLNQSISFSLGNKYIFGENQIGFNSGVNYKKKYAFYNDAQIGRYKQTGINAEKLNAQKIGTESRGDEHVFGSIFMNASLHFNQKHKIKFVSMLNQNGQSSARYFSGENRSDAFGLFEEQRTQRYMERQLKTSQITGNHLFEAHKKSELTWNFGHTKSYQNTPDLKVFTNSYEYLMLEDEDTGDFYQDTAPTYSIQPNLYSAPTRYYRFLKENNTNLKIDYKRNLNQDEFIKIGLSYLEKNRENQEFRYTYNSNGIGYNNSIDDYFSTENTIVGQSINGNSGNAAFINVLDNTEIRNQFTAEQIIMSTYIMSTLKPLEVLEVTAGIRLEDTAIQAQSQDASQTIGKLDNLDFLPALNLKYNIDEGTQIRMSYGRTLARPSFREIAPTAWFDFETSFQFIGNPELKRTLVNNFDLRIEKYLPGAGLISVSGFYKQFNNPIEQVMNPQAQNVELSWRNVQEANVLGMELEYKKKFVLEEGEYLTLGFNTSIIHSKTQIDPLELELIRAFDPEHTATRPMYGQSPYIVNLYTQYQMAGWNVGANFNVSGRSIVIVQKGAVDVYEAPKPMLNLKVDKQISKRTKLSLSASNILSAKRLWYYPYKDEEYTFMSFNYRPEFRVYFQFSL
ncbi:TonB-dependent receptor [Flavobacteriales bacterium]|nr:TonB-dependent receptor [Flavobacteriales bacterium]MDB2653109.1 TonB-dependent receptor [Flavobacteriales bacterium]